jgi:polyisoprenoid-binding protein YceI
MTAIATTPIPAGTTWTVDKVHSTVGFAVKHMVVSTFRSSFDAYDATLTAAEDGTLRLSGSVDA